jgi:2-(1,2-epoxy-1,2-dihydrophenyl)acetyl-CoA isomerase
MRMDQEGAPIMKSVNLVVEDRVAILTLAQPEKRNALSVDMRDDLNTAIRYCRLEPSVLALVIIGSGDTFCSGGDVSTFSDTDAVDRWARMREVQFMWKSLVELHKPVVAAVDGAAYGAGFSLALAADLILATGRARFSLSSLKLGLVPDLGILYTLPRVVGLQRARQLIYSAKPISGKDAERLGIVSGVHRPQDLLDSAKTAAAAMARISPSAFARTKMMLAQSLHLDLASMLELEASAQAFCFQTEHVRTAVAAFSARQQH